MQVTWIKNRKEAVEKAKEMNGKTKIRKAKTSHNKAKKMALEKQKVEE